MSMQRTSLPAARLLTPLDAIPVSYTHLDVYKRQARRRAPSPICRARAEVTSRSSEAVEAGTLLAQSENPLHRCLSWFFLAFLGFGSGVFVLTGQEARFDAGPAIPLAYAAAGFSALLSSFSFSYLRIELGDLAAFLTAGNILLEAVVGAAGLCRSWSRARRRARPGSGAAACGAGADEMAQAEQMNCLISFWDADEMENPCKVDAMDRNSVFWFPGCR
ncbi:hypothetical protein BAE44_0021740 [Dichanthelium oligosanthes]|uniref:Uncharacterized protein n=1 Tax=Dichanthelium oligosanthes TaxID=888268 RepID=A0A1E5UWJ2_9POAL|nr:hypothetical protein BAE44_0021740 [Dichanthelium oligosanthes]